MGLTGQDMRKSVLPGQTTLSFSDGLGFVRAPSTTGAKPSRGFAADSPRKGTTWRRQPRNQHFLAALRARSARAQRARQGRDLRFVLRGP